MNRARVWGQARYHWTLFVALMVFDRFFTSGVSRQPICTDVKYFLYFAAQTADRFLAASHVTHSHVPAIPSAERLSDLEARAMYTYKAARKKSYSVIFKDRLRERAP